MAKTGENGQSPRDPSAVLERALRQMAAFSRVANQIVQEDDLRVACRLFLEAIREGSGHRRAVLTLLDENGRDVQYLFTGYDNNGIDHFHAHKITPAQRAGVFQEKHRVGNSYRVPATAAINYGGLRPDAARHLLFIPLYGAKASLVGTLMLEDRGDETPTAEGLSPLELFAGQMANAVEKKRLDQAVTNVQRQLMQSQLQLMQSEKLSAIGQIVSGVAHELNNPLSGIMGFAQLLLAQELNPKAKKNLERIYNEAVRCQKIVQNLLGFSRRHKPEKTFQSLHDAIERVLELRSYQLKVDDIEVVRHFAADLPKTMYDFHQLQQVILNVVNNAHHAMLEVAVRPRVLTVTTEHRGPMLRLRFADTGPGISRDRLETIFEPFYTTKQEGKGTGLGLSLARAIVKSHLGTMTVESVVGQGTAFTIDLPLLEEQAPGREEEQPPAAAKPARSLRVLVVEDERVLVELLSEFLKSAGHRVDTAANGQIGLDLAMRNDYDIVLTDLKMPGLDGQGLYEKLCAAKPDMARRFIFSTGDLVNPKVQTFFQVTGALYLSKPFKLESVLTLLDQIASPRAA